MTALSNNRFPIQHIIKSLFDNTGDSDKLSWWDWDNQKWITIRIGDAKRLLMQSLIAGILNGIN
jgi:hypothetical protein